MYASRSATRAARSGAAAGAPAAGAGAAGAAGAAAGAGAVWAIAVPVVNAASATGRISAPMAKSFFLVLTSFMGVGPPVAWRGGLSRLALSNGDADIAGWIVDPRAHAHLRE